MEVHGHGSRATLAFDRPHAAAVSGELARILQSDPFQRSPRQRKFLSLIVDRALRGRDDEIKEHTLAVMVFGRHASSFDAQRDPIVRVEAARLRQKLDRYYSGPGADSPVRIAIPKGHYRPVFFTSENGRNRANGANGCNDITTAEVDSLAAQVHDSRAVDCYHRGRYAARQRDAAMFAKAIELFRRAIAFDPQFAAPYAALALALINIAGFVLSPSASLFTDSAEAARQALALDPESADAYTALAVYTHRFQWNWAEAKRLFLRALSLAPKSVSSHVSFGHALATRGRFAEAAEHLQYARHLDPLNVGLRAADAQMLYYSRRYSEAEAELSALLEVAPTNAFAEYVSGVNALYSGKAKEARAAFERASALYPDHPSPHLLVTGTLALEGRHQEARDHLAMLLTNLGQRYYCRYHLAIAHAYLGSRDAMYSALEHAAETRDILLVSLPVEPAFDAYHADERFRSFVAAHGFASLKA